MEVQTTAPAQQQKLAAQPAPGADHGASPAAWDFFQRYAEPIKRLVVAWCRLWALKGADVEDPCQEALWAAWLAWPKDDGRAAGSGPLPPFLHGVVVALDDLALEGDPVGGALLLLGAAQGVRLGVEQGVQGVLDGIAHLAIDMALELALVDLDQRHTLGGNVCYTCHGSPLGLRSRTAVCRRNNFF